MIQIILYLCCYLSGLFFGVMFFTIIENASKGFRQFIRKLCFKFPFYYRRILMWVMLIITAYAGYTYFPFGLTGKGILAGMLGGIFMYFKAGVTMGNTPDDPYGKKGKNKKMKQLKSAKNNK